MKDRRAHAARAAVALLLGSGAAGLGMAALAVACSAPDPGAVDYLGPLPVPGNDATVVMTTTPPPSGDDTADADMTTTAMADAGVVDAAPVDAAPVTLKAFVGAAPFNATIAPGTNAAMSAGTTHHPFPDAGDPFRQDCLSCHFRTGTATDDPWIIGGSVAMTTTGTPWTATVEVRVVGPDGGEVAYGYTDNEGNFWVGQNADASIPFGSTVGVRNATKSTQMSETISTGDCNSSACHGLGSTQGAIYLLP